MLDFLKKVWYTGGVRIQKERDTMRKDAKWTSEIDNLRAMGLQGMTMKQVAEHYGVSRQRIKQVSDEFKLDWDNNYGRAVARKNKLEEYRLKWGEREASDVYASQRSKFIRKKATAKRTGWEWSLNFGDLEWPTHCPILGLELDYFSEHRQENSVSFDRVDSEKGYVKGNVKIMSWRANRIKNNGTEEEHRKIADYLASLD